MSPAREEGRRGVLTGEGQRRWRWTAPANRQDFFAGRRDLATHVLDEHVSLPIGAEVVMPPGPAACPREFPGTLPVNPQACPPPHPKLTVASRTPLGAAWGEGGTY